MGYYKDRNTNEILINETAADIVREIFQKFIDGYGLTTIARNLNKREIKSPEYFSHRRISSQRTALCKKFLWARTSVKRILENEIYTGTLVNHKTLHLKFIKQKVLFLNQNSTNMKIFCLQLLISRLLHRHRNYLKVVKSQTSGQAREERFIVIVDLLNALNAERYWLLNAGNGEIQNGLNTLATATTDTVRNTALRTESMNRSLMNWFMMKWKHWWQESLPRVRIW